LIQVFASTFHQFAHSTATLPSFSDSLQPTSRRGIPNTKTEIISNFKILIKNNEEELELLNYFQKLIFHQKFATPLKVPPAAPLLHHCLLVLLI